LKDNDMAEQRAFLLTWSPKTLPWDDLGEVIATIRRGKPYRGRWTTGKNVSIPRHAKFFMLRQRVEPRGIFAAGTFTSGHYTDDSWREGSRKEENYNDTRIESIRDPMSEPILRTSALADIDVHWSTQVSGIEIHQPFLKEVERRWHKLLGKPKSVPSLVGDADDYEASEWRSRLHTRLERERDNRLVRLKKEKVLRETGKLACECCGFDFCVQYGELASGFAECHHRRPVSKLRKGEKTTLPSLAVVCANCHRVLHRNEGLTVEKLASHLAGRSR
jgi:predicted HNH restriction endonuclease